MAEKLMLSLAKITHTAITEGKQPHVELQLFLTGYCSTPHPATGKSPLQMLILRDIQTKVQSFDSVVNITNTSALVEKVCELGDTWRWF